MKKEGIGKNEMESYFTLLINSHMANTQALSSPILRSPIKLSNEFSINICFQFHSELYFILSCFYLNNKEIIYENFKL